MNIFYTHLLSTVAVYSHFLYTNIYMYYRYCTWDAFYSSVNGEKVLAGVDALSKIGFTPRFLIIGIYSVFYICMYM